MAKWKDPLKVKNVEFANRIVMAPMLPFEWRGKNGIMSDKVLQHYLKHANVGIGLLITQAFLVSPKYDTLDRAGAYSAEHIERIKEIADACHKSGTRMFAQLAYAGFDAKGGGTHDMNDLTTAQMEEMGKAFVDGARICMQAGCDGVEVHCAHSSFINVVNSKDGNHRTDKYGGDLQGRLTLIREIVEGIKAFADDSFIISTRMGWSNDLETDIAMAQAMEKMGMEMLHVSGGIPEKRNIQIPADFDYNEFVYTGAQVKQHVHVPVIVVNDIQTLRRGNALLEAGMCDFVAYGKPFLADARFALKSVENPDYTSCIKCKECKWFTDGDLCPIKIKTEREETRK